MTRWTRHPLTWLGVLFVASRLLAYAVGMRFSLFPLAWYWQYLPVDVLQTNLLHGLYVLHDQPPLYNLYLGLGLKLAGDHAQMAFQASYLALGLAFMVALYALQRQLGVGRWLAAGLVGLFMVGPATLLYENWLFYAYPTAAMLTFGAVALGWLLARPGFGRALAFFAVLAVLALTRSMYHLLWLVAIAGWLAWALPAVRGKVALAAAGPIALVTLWYLKNLLVFGVFAGSSSVGMSFAKVSLGESRPEVRQALHARGVISDLAVEGPWRPLEDYPARYWRLPPTGDPVLDAPRKPSGEPNFHHLAYVGIARQFGQDARHAMVARPDLYLKGVAKAFMIYFRPATDYMLLVENRRLIHPYEMAYNLAFAGKWPARIMDGEVVPPSTALERLGWMFWAMGYGLVLALPLLAAFGWRVARHDADRDRRLLVAFLLFNLAWVTASSNFIEVGDNNRYRYDIDGFYLALLALAIQAWWGRRAARG